MAIADQDEDYTPACKNNGSTAAGCRYGNIELIGGRTAHVFLLHNLP